MAHIFISIWCSFSIRVSLPLHKRHPLDPSRPPKSGLKSVGHLAIGSFLYLVSHEPSSFYLLKLPTLSHEFQVRFWHILRRPPRPVGMVSSPQRTKVQKNASHVVLWLLIYLCVKYLLPSTFEGENYQKQPHISKPSIIYPPGAFRSQYPESPFTALSSWCSSWASQTPSQPPRMELRIRSERPARKTTACFLKHWEQWKKKPGCLGLFRGLYYPVLVVAYLCLKQLQNHMIQHDLTNDCKQYHIDSSCICLVQFA